MKLKNVFLNTSAIGVSLVTVAQANSAQFPIADCANRENTITLNLVGIPSELPDSSGTRMDATLSITKSNGSLFTDQMEVWIYRTGASDVTFYANSTKPNDQNYLSIDINTWEDSGSPSYPLLKKKGALDAYIDALDDGNLSEIKYDLVCNYYGTSPVNQ